MDKETYFCNFDFQDTALPTKSNQISRSGFSIVNVTGHICINVPIQHKFSITEVQTNSRGASNMPKYPFHC